MSFVIFQKCFPFLSFFPFDYPLSVMIHTLSFSLLTYFTSAKSLARHSQRKAIRNMMTTGSFSCRICPNPESVFNILLIQIGVCLPPLQLTQFGLSLVIHCANGSVFRYETNAAGDHLEEPQGSQFFAGQHKLAFAEVSARKQSSVLYLIHILSFPAPITVFINWTLAPPASMHAPSRHRTRAALWGAVVWTFDKHRRECSTVESVSRSRWNRKAIRNYSTSIAGGEEEITTYACVRVLQ